jgi:hypothetical protein
MIENAGLRGNSTVLNLHRRFQLPTLARNAMATPARPDITLKNYLTVGPGEYPCGNNLYLIVSPSGGRRWTFRYQRAGIVKKMGLGSAKANTGLKPAKPRKRPSIICG